MTIFELELGTELGLPLSPRRLAGAEAGLVDADDEVVLAQRLRLQIHNRFSLNFVWFMRSLAVLKAR